MLARILLSGLLAHAAFAQADPKPSAAGYPASTQAAGLAFGAEYLGRTFFVDGRAYASGNFLVVDLAAYPLPGGAAAALKWSSFAVRFNGKRESIFASSPGHVAISQRLEPWNENRRGLTAGAGTPAGGIVLGGPAQGPRFPGDPSVVTPPVPRAPTPDHDQRVEREHVDFGDLVSRSVIAEGPVEKPRRGYLFFPYSGKLAKLSRIDLVITAPDGETVVALQRKK